MTDELHRFRADWLSLREPVDHRSRAAGLIPPLAEAWQTLGWRRLVDLGCGTGSNLRFLSPLLPGAQEWVVVDRDQDHLNRLIDLAQDEESRTPGVPTRTIHPVCGSVEGAGLSEIDGADLVTCSALLDLVSEAWLRELVHAVAHGAERGAYFALSYNGDIQWSVPDPVDAAVRDAVNAHQLQDKGMGPALGPEASDLVVGLLEDAGFRTETRASPWRLQGPTDSELATALVLGWAEAASEERPADAASFRAWRARRLDTIRGGDYDLRVGHHDVLALPT